MNKAQTKLFLDFLNTNLQNSLKLQDEAYIKMTFELAREYQYKANVYYTVLQVFNKLNQKTKGGAKNG